MSKKLSTDADLLKWAPMLFRDHHLPGQRLADGVGGVTGGIDFTCCSARFLDAGVQPGHILQLTDMHAGSGCYEILGVEFQTVLVATQVGRSEDPLDLPAGNAWGYTIDTFDPQAEEVRFELLSRLGLVIDGEHEDAEAATWTQRALRRASVFGCMVMILEGQWAATDAKARNVAAKAALYRRLYDKELAMVRVRLDRHADEAANGSKG